MKIRATGIIVLLSCTVFMLGINGCDQSEKNSSQAKTVHSETSFSSQKPSPPAEQADNKEPVVDNPTGNKATEDDAQEDKKALRLSPREYGRENPFEPVVKKSLARKSNVKRPSTTVNKREEITIHLTAVLGKTAILRVDSVDKPVSVGDTVNGMKILEIRSGEVLLDKGGKKHTIALGAQVKL